MYVYHFLQKTLMTMEAEEKIQSKAERSVPGRSRQRYYYSIEDQDCEGDDDAGRIGGGDDGDDVGDDDGGDGGDGQVCDSCSIYGEEEEGWEDAVVVDTNPDYE